LVVLAFYSTPGGCTESDTNIEESVGGSPAQGEIS